MASPRPTNLQTLAEQCALNIAPLLSVLQADPGNDEVLNQVNTVLMREDDWTTCAAVNEFVADALANVDRQLPLYLKAGELWEQKASDHATAFRAFNKALSVSPGSVPALQGAVRNLEQVQEFTQGVILISNHAAKVEDTDEAARLWACCARWRIEHLNDRAGALADLKKAAEKNAGLDDVADVARLVFGDDEGAYASFLADASGAPPSANGAADRATGPTEPEQSAPAEPAQQIEAAPAAPDPQPEPIPQTPPAPEVTVDEPTESSAEPAEPSVEPEPIAAPAEPAQPAQPQQPEVEVEEAPVAKLPPDAPDRIEALRNEGKYAEVAQILEHQRAAASGTDQIDVLKQLIDLYEGPLNLPHQAADHLATLLTLHYDVRVEQRLKLFYERLERWEDLVTLHTSRAEHEEGDRWLIRIKYAARLCDGQLNDPLRAAEFYEQIREKAPDDSEANQELSRLYEVLLETDPAHDAAITFLEDKYASRGDHKAIAELHEQLGKAIDLGGERRAQHLRHAAHIWEEQLQDDLGALRCWTAVLTIHPSDIDAADAAIRLAERSSQFPNVVQTIAEHVAAIQDSERKGSLLLRSARIRALNLDDLDAASADLKRAQHEHVVASELMETAAAVLGGDHAQLAQYLEELADHAADDALRLEAYGNAATIFRERLHNLDSAIRVLEKATEHEELGGPLHRRLLAHYSDARRWDAYLKGLHEERDSLAQQNETSSDRYREVLLAIAETYEAPLGEPGKAAAIFEELLRIAPDENVAWRLEALYAAAGQFEALITHHLKQAGDDPEAETWKEHTLTAADLCLRELDDPRRACVLYERVVEVDPTALRPLEALCDIYEADGNWQQLAHTCERAAAAHRASSSDPSIAQSFLHRAASVLESRIRVPADAATMYEQILAGDPQDQRAAGALVRIRREQYDPHALVTALRALAEAATDSSVRRDTRIEEGRTLLTALDDPASAAVAFRHALEADNWAIEAWHGLQESLRQTEQPAELLKALDAELALVEDTARRGEIQREAARLLEDSDDQDFALDRWTAARQAEPGNLQTLHALLKHHTRRGEAEKQADVLRALAEHETTRDDRADAHYKLAVLYRDRDRKTALAEAQTALELNERHKDAVAFLRSLAEDEADWPRVVSLLAREAHLPSPAATRSALLHHAAEISRAQLSDGEGAATLDAQAVQLDPDNVEAARPLADWYYRHTQFQRAKPLYDHFGIALALEDSDESRADVHYRHAVVCRELLQVDEAIAHLEDARATFPSHVTSLELLASLHRDREAWTEARVALEALLELGSEARDAALMLKAHIALAEVTEAAGDRDAAIDHYRRILGINASHRGATTELLRLYSNDGMWAESVAVLDFMLRQTQDANEIADIHRQRGEILGERRKNWKAAADAYMQAVDAAPERMDIRLALAEACAKAGRWQKAADEYLPLAEATSLSASERADHWIARAEILHKRVGDIFGAQKAYEGALRVEPKDDRALGALATLYEKNEQWPDLVGVLQRMAETRPDSRSVSVADLRTRAAWFLVHRMEDVSGAVHELRLALEAVPDYPAALDKFAELVSSDPAYDDDALDVHHRLLRQNPYRANSLRALAGVYERRNRTDVAAWLGNLHKLLERPAGAPLQRGSGAVDILNRNASEALGPEELHKRVLHPAEHGPLTDMLKLLSELGRNVMPPELEQWGVSAPEGSEDGPGLKRVFKGLFGGGGSNEPANGEAPPIESPKHIRDVVDALFAALPVGRMNVVSSAVPDLFLTIENTSPPLMILGPQLSSAWAGDAVHALIRGFLHVAAGRSLWVQLGSEGATHALLAALAAMVDDAKTATNLATHRGASAEYLKGISKAIPRKVKKESKDLAESAFEILKQNSRALDDWSRALEWSGDRTVLLLMGDLPAVFWAALRRDIGNPAIDDPAELYQQIRSSSSCRELATFASSQEFLRMRDRLGLGAVAAPRRAATPPPDAIETTVVSEHPKK